MPEQVPHYVHPEGEPPHIPEYNDIMDARDCSEELTRLSGVLRDLRLIMEHEFNARRIRSENGPPILDGEAQAGLSLLSKQLETAARKNTPISVTTQIQCFLPLLAGVREMRRALVHATEHPSERAARRGEEVTTKGDLVHNFTELEASLHGLSRRMATTNVVITPGAVSGEKEIEVGEHLEKLAEIEKRALVYSGLIEWEIRGKMTETIRKKIAAAEELDIATDPSRNRRKIKGMEPDSARLSSEAKVAFPILKFLLENAKEREHAAGGAVVTTCILAISGSLISMRQNLGSFIDGGKKSLPADHLLRDYRSALNSLVDSILSLDAQMRDKGIVVAHGTTSPAHSLIPDMLPGTFVEIHSRMRGAPGKTDKEGLAPGGGIVPG